MSERLDELRSALSGRYEIEKEIGQGGMATVYLARDVKHNRQVAVKVLRSDLSAALGPERFLREIEIAANLTHPHILPLHDSGESDGFLYYVMPFIKGNTLRERIENEGELPVSEAVRIVREVTDALAFAHSQGVVHRDIKPDNVMLSGRHAMVMDFGVAKAVSEATGRNTLTTVGVALGTPTYMAPEQATADPHVDHRADIYAVGVMAYELLAGRTPFQGASPQAVLAAHVTEAAEPVSKHRDQVSPELESVVMKCLAKKPADRWQSADEMMPLLESMTTSSSGITPTSTLPVQKGISAGPRRRAWWMAAGAVAAMAVIAIYGSTLLGSNELSITVANMRQLTHSPELDIEPELSPDGQDVLYSAGHVGSFHLFIRNVEGGPALALTEGLSGEQQVGRWHPSGGSVEFSNDLGTPLPQHYRVSKFGGQLSPLRAFTLAETEAHSWVTIADTLWQVERESGDTVGRWLLPFDGYDFRLSPDRSRLSYANGNPMYYITNWLGNTAPGSVWVMRLADSSSIRLAGGDGTLNQSPVWLANDAVAFVSNRDGRRDLYAVEVSATGQAAGEPVRLTTGADVHTVSVSGDGSVMAFSQLRFRSNLYEIELADTGQVSVSNARPITRLNQSIENHDRSDDGRWLVYDSDVSGNQEIYLVDLEGGEPRAVTSDPGQDMDPMFSPDLSEIVFYSTRNGSRDLYLVTVDGGRETRLTGDQQEGWGADDHEMLPEFSPDGLHITYMASNLGYGVNRLMSISRDSVGGQWGPPRLLADSMFASSSWSPDSRQVVFAHETGLDVVTMDGERRPLVVGRKPAGGSWVLWASDDRIFFHGLSEAGQRGIYVVDGSEATTGMGLEPRLAVAFDQPGMLSPGFALTLVGNSLVFTMDEKESDILLMDLEY